MSTKDWILLGLILFLAGIALAYLLRGKKGGCCGSCQNCGCCGKK